MFKPRALKLLCLLLTATGMTAAWAGEPSVVVPPDHPALEWGPFPDFMPAGCEIAVLHGDPAAPNADVLFRVPGDAHVPAHRHTSAERMVLISGELRVTYEGQDEAVMQAGDYAFGPPDRPHTAYCAPGTPCVLFIAFEQPVDAIPVE